MHEYQFLINGNPYNVKILEITEEHANVEVNGTTYRVNIEQLYKSKPKTPRLVRSRVVETSIQHTPLTEKPGKKRSIGTIEAPLPGIILKVLVKEGEQVKTAQELVKMEAMKMENDIQSPVDGTVTKIYVKEGESVLEGAPLVKIE